MKKFFALTTVAALALAASAYAEEAIRIDTTHSYSGFVIDTVKGTTNWGKDTADFVRVVFDGSSTESMTIGEDIEFDSIEYKRTFTPETYTTVIFPFDVYTNYNGSNLSCVTIQGPNFYKFAGVSDNNTLNFIYPWSSNAGNNQVQGLLEANVPYLMQLHDVTLNDDNTLRVLTRNQGDVKLRVTLKKTPSQEVLADCDTCGAWEFHGTYDYKKWSDGNDSLGKLYGYAAKDKDVTVKAADGVTDSTYTVKAGTFVKAKAGAYIPPMRAFVYYNNQVKSNKPSLTPSITNYIASTISVEDLPSELSIRILDEDGNTQAIGKMNTVTGEITMDKDAWFDMKGRRFNKMPTIKGTYYNQGKQVIIK